jgi:predicted nucleic acid-binding protein
LSVYIDSSVVLRVLLRQPGALRDWRKLTEASCSALVEVECLRTLDRMRVAGEFGESVAVELRAAVYRLLESFTVVEVTRPILARASQPLPVGIGTLDAIHLATALALRDATGSEIAMATHDAQLGLAARAMGLAVVEA